jgi:hypothetical protein
MRRSYILPLIQLSFWVTVRWAGTIGFAFYFHEILVRDAPERVFHTIIAHELAHAFQMARERAFFSDLVANPERLAAHERAAVFLTREWGFDQAAATEWCKRNID